MKKPFRGDGMAFSKLLYGDDLPKVATSSKNSNCSEECHRTSPSTATRDGRNMAIACRSLKTNVQAIDRVFDQFSDKYCEYCQIKFKSSFWTEMEAEDGK